MIQLENLSKSFGTKTVFSNVSANFEKGKVYGIVGENGAGKTTLFRSISGLENCEGIIKSNYSPLKNHLGYLTTDPFFFDKITGKEYLQLLCNARNIESPEFDSKNIFDLPLHQFAQNYSTGMKKKLALTGILLQKNEAFILDEPFNGVDIHGNLLITQIIKKLKEQKKTILISSHIFSTLRDTCDEIIVLKDGAISTPFYQHQFDQLENDMSEFTIENQLKDFFDSDSE